MYIHTCAVNIGVATSQFSHCYLYSKKKKKRWGNTFWATLVYLMGPLSYIWSVVDRNVVMRHISVLVMKHARVSCLREPDRKWIREGRLVVSASPCECGRSCWPNRKAICSAFPGIHRPSLKDGRIEKSKLTQMPVKEWLVFRYGNNCDAIPLKLRKWFPFSVKKKQNSCIFSSENYYLILYTIYVAHFIFVKSLGIRNVA
jgi:hypothetical protein